MLLVEMAAAQTLARPGWAGSGLAADAWWRNAVFYRIDVRHFQDADGDGVGDLRGVIERLDYLQSLGVDAVVLELPPSAPAQAEAQFDDLLRQSNSQHIRIVVSLSPAEARDNAVMLGSARRWLTRGAAGIALPSALLRSSAAARSSTARELHALVMSMPGERVLLAMPEAGSGARGELAMADGADLIGLSTDIPQRDTDAAFPGALRRALVDVQSPPGNTAPLLYSDNCCRTADAELFPEDAARTLGMNKITAARLMTSRGAVAMVYGQEIGLLDSPGESSSAVMRWTPLNVTVPKAVEAATPVVAVPPQRPDVYGEFKPYVRPTPVKKVTPEEARQQAIDALPGFSADATSAPVDRSQANVAAEDAEAGSLLNFYRRLSQLHHDNPSLRAGTPYVLDHDREQALVWVRRAPVGARTAATVVVACNLGAKALTLSLSADFERLRIRSGTLRPLLASWTQTPTVQASDSMQLPPYSVFIGELYHDAR